MKQLSWKCNKKHAILEQRIRELDPNQDMTRSGITNRSIRAARNQSFDSWIDVRNQLPTLLKGSAPDISIPTAMQAKVDDSSEKDLAVIGETIKQALGLDVLQTQFLIQLLWKNYLNYLQDNTKIVGVKLENSDLTGPEMVKRLVEILLLNREIDWPAIEGIKRILLEWEE